MIGDEVRGPVALGRRARKSSSRSRTFAKTLGPDLDARFYAFDSKVDRAQGSRARASPKAEGPRDRAGLGDAARSRSGRRTTSRRIARLVILSDFASNNGADPLEVARQLKGQGVPVVTVGLGTENAGAAHKDIALRDIVTGPTGLREKQARRARNDAGARVCQPDARRRAVRRGPGGARRQDARSRSPTAPM